MYKMPPFFDVYCWGKVARAVDIFSIIMDDQYRCDPDADEVCVGFHNDTVECETCKTRVPFDDIEYSDRGMICDTCAMLYEFSQCYGDGECNDE